MYSNIGWVCRNIACGIEGSDAEPLTLDTCCICGSPVDMLERFADGRIVFYPDNSVREWGADGALVIDTLPWQIAAGAA